MGDHFRHDTTKRPEISGEGNPENFGPRVMLFDAWRGQGWDLLSHGGFVTYPHHDASGLCTYVYPRSGCKIWGYFLPSIDQPGQNREVLFKKFDKLPGIAEGDFKKEEMGTILLEEGEIL